MQHAVQVAVIVDSQPRKPAARPAGNTAVAAPIRVQGVQDGGFRTAEMMIECEHLPKPQVAWPGLDSSAIGHGREPTTRLSPRPGSWCFCLDCQSPPGYRYEPRRSGQFLPELTGVVCLPSIRTASTIYCPACHHSRWLANSVSAESEIWTCSTTYGNSIATPWHAMPRHSPGADWVTGPLA